MTQAGDVPPGIDTSTPSPARMYDYMLGGQHNFPVDREATERFRARMPDLMDAAWANRGFHGRAAIWMVEQGIRQFIDIGSGLPTQNNTHEVVQKVAPNARVGYVDIDPMVKVLSAELIPDDGSAVVLNADLRDPEAILADPDLRRLIDFSRPVGLLMTAVLQFVADDDDPWGLVGRYVAAVPPGSYLALSHITGDWLPPQAVERGTEVYQSAAQSAFVRTKDEIQRFFAGTALVPPWPGAEPGLTYPGVWGAEDPEVADSDGGRAFYCGVARIG
jgi:hypothetical protein